MYSTGIAYLLWLIGCFGFLGFHRLYLGKIGTGLLWMFTGGLLGIGSIYDLITLSRQVKEENFKRAIIDDAIRSNAGSSWRNVDDGQSRIISDKYNSEKHNVEHIVLKVAKANKGIITASELALASKSSIEEAKKTLDVLVSKGHAELRVRQSGSLVYVIPDLMDSNEPLVD
jgi:TM2 domain-containing membrane protein YozV